MKKTIIISAVFPPEPVVSATLSRDLAEELAKNNHVEVICPKPTRPHGFKFKKEPTPANYKVCTLESYTCSESKLIGRLRESYSFGVSSSKYIKVNHKDIELIYANSWPLFGQYFVVKAARKYKIPIILHVQDVYPESLASKMPILGSIINTLLLPLDKYILRNATKVIAISDKMKNYLSTTRMINKDDIATLQNWQNEEDFHNFKLNDKAAISENGSFTFMYLGNIGPVAGIELLINSFVRAEFNNCKLVIAGSGSVKELLQNMVLEHNYQNIEFWSVPTGQVPAIQNQADVMLLPIKKGAAGSSIPSKLPAYMFSAKPIIVCADEDSDTANAILLSNSGWVIEPENEEKLIETMRFARDASREELSVKGQNGYIYAMSHLSKKNNLNQLVSLIQETKSL